MLNDNRMLFYFASDSLSMEFLKDIEDINRAGEKVKVWREKFITGNELRYDIKETNNPENPNCFFKTYELDKNSYKHYKIYANQYVILPKNKLAPIEINISNIYVHLFKTGLGFVDFGYSVKSESAKDFLNCSYFLSEMKSEVKIQLINRKWDSETNKAIHDVEEITTIDFLKRILADFKKVYTLDYKDDLKYLYFKPILYSYIYLENGKNNLVEFENISHNFKASYKLNNEVVKKSQYFENSIWYYSSSSISNISYEVEDDYTNSFFKTTFRDKISSVYFLLFLHSFHQKLYLILTTIRMHSNKFNSNNANELSALSDEILVFKQQVEETKMNVFFQYPSSIDHHNVFYSNLQQQFNISELIKILDSDLKNLERYLSSNLTILSKYNSAKGDIRKTIMDIILLLIASLVSFASLYDTFLKMLKNLKIELSLTGNIIYAVLFIIICLVLPTTINIIKNVKKIKNNKKEMKRINHIMKKGDLSFSLQAKN